MKRAVLFMVITLVKLVELAGPAVAEGPAIETRESVQIARMSHPQAVARPVLDGVESAAIEARVILLPIYVPPSRSAPSVRAGGATRGPL